MVKDMKYIIKRILIGVGIAIVLMALKNGLVLNTHAMTIKFYNTNASPNLCATCNYKQCNYTGTGTCSTINRISISDPNYTLSSGVKYDLFTTIDIDVLFPTLQICPTDLGFSNNFYIGNANGTSWNSASSVSWNNIDDINPGINSSCRYTWGLVQRTNNTLNSNGMTFDFYFSSAKRVQRVYVKRYELQSVGSSNDSSSANTNAIISANNNNTQSIINNNNQNTNTIINNNNENANKINDTMKDETAPSDNDINDLFDIDTNDSNSPVSDLITMPITLLQAYLNGFNSSCSSFNLGTLYGHNLTMPCIQPQRYLGSTLWNLIDMCISLFLAYNVGLMCISIYESITSLDDNFQTLYTPRHAESDYKPKHGGSD